MAHSTGPLFSLEAHGSLGDAITFGRRGKTNTIKRKNKPANPRTLAQIQSRAPIAIATAIWQQLADAPKESWAPLAEQKGVTNFNAFVSWNANSIKNNGGIRYHYKTGGAPGDGEIDFMTATQVGPNVRIFLQWDTQPVFNPWLLITLSDVSAAAAAQPSATVLGLKALDLGSLELFIPKVPPGSYWVGYAISGSNGELHARDQLTTVVVT